MNQIIVEVRGGLISNILNIPRDVEVVVRDYDVEGVGVDPDDPLLEDEEGEEYCQTVWLDIHPLFSDAKRLSEIGNDSPMTEEEKKVLGLEEEMIWAHRE